MGKILNRPRTFQDVLPPKLVHFYLASIDFDRFRPESRQVRPGLSDFRVWLCQRGILALRRPWHVEVGYDGPRWFTEPCVVARRLRTKRRNARGFLASAWYFVALEAFESRYSCPLCALSGTLGGVGSCHQAHSWRRRPPPRRTQVLSLESGFEYELVLARDERRIDSNTTGSLRIC